MMFKNYSKSYLFSLENKPILIRKKEGKFIVFEGLDGSGTTTQATLLVEYLKKEKKKVHLTREPTTSLIGGLIESQLRHDWKSSPLCLQLLFTADRAYHLEKEIAPLLKRGISVICVRYILSTFAYGAIGIKDTSWLLNLNKNFIWPDITFFLKVSPKTCLQRIKKERFHRELFEKEEKLKKVLRAYLNFSKKFKNIYLINGEKTIPQVFEEIKKITIKRIF